MTRRDFIARSSAALGAVTVGSPAHGSTTLDANWYQHARRFAALPMSRVAYVEKGHGPVALFLHGFPLNGYQWRGALERLHPYRRCIAPDCMSLGHTETPTGQEISPAAQVTMLGAFLDSLKVDKVDLVANDSGGLVAQLFVARHPERVRTLLLTNCDVDENNPPPKFLPAVGLAKRNQFAGLFITPQVKDKNFARSIKGIGGAYTHPESLTDETLDIYLAPLIASPERQAQLDQYTAALGENVLVPVRENLRNWNGQARMVWAMKDEFFEIQWADWLDHTLSHSSGVRRVEEANLFFPEEMPDLIAEEAKRLWNVG